MPSELEPETDLLWLALRYVAGELGHDEAEAFERRLDQDQDAREAVAGAVELAGAVAAQKPKPATVIEMPMRRRRHILTGLGVATLAAAACLAWLALSPRGPAGLTLTPNADVPGTVVAGKTKPSAIVTLAWSDLRQESEAENDEPNGLPEAELPMLAETDEASDHGLPLWLLDAASLAGRPGAGAGTDAAPAKEL